MTPVVEGFLYLLLRVDVSVSGVPWAARAGGTQTSMPTR